MESDLHQIGLERQRRAHSKSRKGCLPCRARHVKCDETKPSCSACVQMRKECTYVPVQPRAPRKTPRRTTNLEFRHTLFTPIVHAVGSTTTIATDTDLRALEFFCSKNLPRFDDIAASHGWAHVVYTTQLQYPFLRQCCIALGAQNAARERAWAPNTVGTDVSNTTLLHEKYQTALASTRKAMRAKNADPLPLMLSNCFLTLFAAGQGWSEDVGCHLAIGAHLAYHGVLPQEGECVRGVLQALTYQFIAKAGRESELPGLQQILDSYPLTPSPVAVEDLATARSSLHSILPSFTAFMSKVSTGTWSSREERVHHSTPIFLALDNWHREFTSVVAHAAAPPANYPARCLIEALYRTVLLELHTAIHGCSASCPDKSEHVPQIMSGIQIYAEHNALESSTFTWNTGIPKMLDVVAMNCQDEDSRVSLRSLASRVPRNEGPWSFTISDCADSSNDTAI